MQLVLKETYATGYVIAGQNVSPGGLVGANSNAIVTYSYWDTQSSAQASGAGGTGLTTAQLQSSTLPSGFDPTVWGAGPGAYPWLLWQLSNPSLGPSFAEAIREAVATPTISSPTNLLGIPLTDAEIDTTFRPNFGYTLKAAAALGGFDHFNWLNVITRDDELFLPFAGTLFAGLKDQYGNLPIVPYADPVPGGYQYQLDQRKSEGTATKFPVRDNLPWFWDERYSFECQVASSKPVVISELEGVISDPHVLPFEDMPSSFRAETISFLTCLAGVYPDGAGVVFSDTNTCFSWDDVGNIISGSGQISVRENINPNLSGGTATFTGFLSADLLLGAGGNPVRALGISIVNAEKVSRFAGRPGQPDCVGTSVSALARQYGGLTAAATALNYNSVNDLQNALKSYCLR
jgi:hypothetical protein